MATLLDTMVLELNLDSSKFRRAEREAEDELKSFHESVVESGKEIERGGAKISEFFTVLKRGALGLGAAFLGGAAFEQFINHIARLDAATGRTARNIGMNVVELRAWQQAAKNTGGTIEGVTASLATLNDQLQLAQMGKPNNLTALLRTTGINPFGKTADQLAMELAGYVERRGIAPNAVAPFLRQFGMDESMINLIQLGTRELSKLLTEQRKLAAEVERSAPLAQEYQRALGQVDDAATKLGETLFVKIAPGLTAFLTSLQNSIPVLRQVAEAFGKVGSNLGGIAKFFGDVVGSAGSSLWEQFKSLADPAAWAAGMGRSGIGYRQNIQGGGDMSIPHIGGDPRHLEAYIRERALAHGIDPDTAVRVARSEGLASFFGDQGTSFGAFQAHITPGGRGGHVGDLFRRDTGLDPSLKENERALIDYQLARIATHGWGEYHGAARVGIRGFAGIGRPGGGAAAVPYLNYGPHSSLAPSMQGGGSTMNSSATSVSISNLNIHTQATDARGIARDIKPEIERLAFASQGNALGGIV